MPRRSLPLLAAWIASLAIQPSAGGQPNAIVLKSGGIEFADGSVQTTAATGGSCSSHYSLHQNSADVFVLPLFSEHSLRAEQGGRDTFLGVAYIGPGAVTVELFLFDDSGGLLKSATNNNVCAPCLWTLAPPDGGVVDPQIAVRVDLQDLIVAAGGFDGAELSGVGAVQVGSAGGDPTRTAVVVEVVAACGA
jgi:hypothetical protein